MNRPNFHPAAQAVDFAQWREELYPLGHALADEDPRPADERTPSVGAFRALPVVFVVAAFLGGLAWPFGSWVAGGAW